MKNLKNFMITIFCLMIGLNSNYYRLILISNGRTIKSKEYALILLKNKSETFLPLENLYKERRYYLGYKCENDWEVYQIKKFNIDMTSSVGSNRLMKFLTADIIEKFFDQEEFEPDVTDMKLRRKTTELIDFEKQEDFYIIDRIKIFSDTGNGCGDFKGFNLELVTNKLIFVKSVHYVLDFFKKPTENKKINIDLNVLKVNVDSEKGINFEIKMSLKKDKDPSTIDIKKLNIIHKIPSQRMKKKYKLKIVEKEEENEKIVFTSFDTEIGSSEFFRRNKKQNLILFCSFILDGINRLHRIKKFRSEKIESSDGSRIKYLHQKFTRNTKEQFIKKDFVYFCFNKNVLKVLHCDLEDTVEVKAEMNNGGSYNLDSDDLLNIQIIANCKENLGGL